ncbi:DUF1553 domain-containing protein [Acidobacteria bacterium AH-259-A15]|nr:DUF1553 domain-containing protein [Acidobacteria bacterium AH-259-A15]
MRKFPSERWWKGSAGAAFVLCAVLGTLLSGMTAGSQQADRVSFSTEVLPLLQEKCFQCHGEAQQMSNFDLQTRAGALKGGLHGPAIVPGKPEESRLYRRVSGIEEPIMPFGGSLMPEEIELLRRWITQGAEYTVEPGQADREWWSFKKPVRHPVPQVSDPLWSENPIDAFLMKRLEEKGLQPAPPADKRTLVRRAYLDLVGLLPSHEEVTAFIQDDSGGAFEKVINRLLDSPHYGERWGRHWLDVARYADSGGYEHDYDYPNAWRYRDYVIRSFNEDKPYDQFILEQLAGDELDQVTHDSLTATGFNRVLATVGFREKDNPQYRYIYLNDMITTTSHAFMALSVECARCHDHKFDPIQQLDYYRMMAIFFPFVKYDHPLAPPEQVTVYETRKAEIEAQIQPLKERIKKIEKPYRKIAFEKKLAKFPEEIQIVVRTPEAERTPGQKLLADQVLSIRVGAVSELLSPEDKAEIERIKEQIKEIEKELPEPLPVAMGIRDGDYRFAPDGLGDEVQPGKGDREFYDFEGTFLPQSGKPYIPPPAHFLPTADYRNKGPEVQPGFLQVLTQANPPAAHPPSNDYITTGRRRALAEWIIREDHRLTARVMVNRIWQHHFGRGLVSTPSNFGRMGQPPSHPELLDWLAIEFVRHGWSTKHMHRLMMTSQAYRMSSSHYLEANAKIDPVNIYLWRYHQHRLEAEVIRDIILTASGNLNLKVGGKPFFPPIPEKVRESFTKGEWEMTQEGPEVWRRSIYSYWKRGLRYPMFDVFDLPDLNVTCERRTTTTVPTQALTLLNNEFVFQQSEYFAKRVWEQAGRDAAGQVKTAYRIALSREPGATELDRNVAFLRRQSSYHARADAASNPELEALADFCSVVLNLNEFVYIN